jgi:CopG family nickel-responsive transcriptional regulator
MKKRFGVSIPKELAERVDDLAEKLDVSRSEVIQEALKAYIRDHIHYLIRHECCGIITLVSENLEHLKVVEDFRDIIAEFTHIHVEGICVNSFIVSGDSLRIAELHNRLLKVCKEVRFIPLRGCKI